MFYHEFNELAEPKINLEDLPEEKPRRVGLAFYLLALFGDLFASPSSQLEQRDRDIIENNLHIFIIPIK